MRTESPEPGRKIAFRMQLNPGCADVYRARHDAIWPELVALLRTAGISDYSIFIDDRSDTLFAVLRSRDETGRQGLAETAVMRRWWRYMRDVMETDADGAPIAHDLPCLFHMD